ncbi:MAG: RNA polymerase sigma factor [Sandaracinus sp.]
MSRFGQLAAQRLQMASSSPRSSPVSGAGVAVLGTPDVEDAELVARALSGDAWASGAIFRRHVGVVTSLVRKSFGRTAEADDIVQDTFAIALDELRALRNPAALRSWLLTIAVRQMHRRFSKRRLLRALGLDRNDYAADLVALDPAADPEAKAELRLLAEAMEKLAPAERLAWTLRHAHGHALAEVATLTSCSLATAKRRIARADELLRAHFGITHVGMPADETTEQEEKSDAS